MILSIAHAEADEAAHANMFGAWSDLVIGNRPDGLIDCYLVRSDLAVQVVAVWESLDAHDRAVSEGSTHPAYLVFEAAGLDPVHSVSTVIGSIHEH